MKRNRSLWRSLNNQKGQMLLVVFIVLMLLVIIVFAIIENVIVDIKETQVEREYEKGYTLAEEELVRIVANEIDPDLVADYTELTSGSLYDAYCPTADPCSSGWKCYLKRDADTGEDVIVKRCGHTEIFDQLIRKDETLEVYLSGYTGDIHVEWATPASAISLIVVYTDVSGNYLNVRRAVCREGNKNCYAGSSFENYTEVFTGANKDFNIKDDFGIASGTVLMRIRAIGGDAKGVEVSGGTGLPVQMVETRVQGFAAGTDLAEGLPGPEVYTLRMQRKQLPALFDYVLFVANGDVSK